MTKPRTIILSLLLFVCSLVFAQQDLTLEKVTIVSRHSVRAPLEQYLQSLDEMTGDGYQWTRWSVPGSNLTLRGGALETFFGEYFRLWLEKEHFALDSTDVYFGASSKQRTIATARAFAAGMLPLMTVPVDFKVDDNGNVGFPVLSEIILRLYVGIGTAATVSGDNLCFAVKLPDFFSFKGSFDVLYSIDTALFRRCQSGCERSRTLTSLYT